MILDARTILLLFVDGLSALVLPVLLWLAVKGRTLRAEPARLEDLGQLLALALGALLLLRTVAWGTLFAVLDGYVPGFASHGVMCAYGVVQLEPELARAALWSKPPALAGLLLWWALALAERGGAEAPFLRLRFALAAPLALLCAADVAMEAQWLFADKLEPLVTCCRAQVESAGEREWVKADAFLGLPRSAALPAALALQAAGVVACLAFSRGKLTLPRALALCLFASWVGSVDLAAWRELYAPRALGLEFHRCAYELATRSLALGLAALLSALAHLALLSLPLLAVLAPREPAGTADAAARIARLAALAFATELAVVAVHLY